MKYYFINTDRGARKDVETCNLWFDHNMAFSGNDWKKYGLCLQVLNPYDICLMYHNGSGIVGIGRVLKSWDGKPHKADKILYITETFNEYRIGIDWYIDLRDRPFDPRDAYLYIPRGFLNKIKQKEKAADLIARFETDIEYRGPNELYIPSDLQEGRVKNVPVDIHERNPIARRKCIEYYGAICNVCGFVFSDHYGPVGDGLIHIHHLSPINMTNSNHQVDPVNDLRPVCPNCHTIIHCRPQPFSIEEVKKLIENNRNPILE